MGSSERKLLLLGGGGHCRSIIDCLKDKYDIVGIVDRKDWGEVLGVSYFGTEEKLKEFDDKTKFTLNISFAGVGTLEKRSTIFNKFKSLGFTFEKIISPTSHFSKYSEIGEGTIVMGNGFCGPVSKVGVNTILNNGVHVEHDCLIGDHCHLAPRSIVAGGVSIGSKVFLGAGAVVKENLEIGDNVIIGAGVTVYKNVPSCTTIVSQADMDTLK